MSFREEFGKMFPRGISRVCGTNLEVPLLGDGLVLLRLVISWVNVLGPGSRFCHSTENLWSEDKSSTLKICLEEGRMVFCSWD